MRHSENDIISIPPDGRPESEQPQWRRDFPIDWPQDEYVARRDFTKFLMLTSFAFMVGQFWIVLQNFLRTRQGRPPIREIASLASLPIGATHIFDYPNRHDNCLLVRTGEDRFIAYSQSCTHLSCPVQPRPESNTLHCPCHEGTFDMATGRPISGPPRRPLTRVTLEIRGEKIYATGIEERTI
jgi:Rieske Fe-S protein